MSYSDDLPPVRPHRPDGWTVGRQWEFLDDLARHGRVAVAAAAVGMSVSSAYRLRDREQAFAFGWRAATALAYERLRDAALDRALNGVAAPHYYRGEVVGESPRYSDRLMLGLLNHLRPEGSLNHNTGKRGEAIEPATLWAAAVHSYEFARETGAPPVAPDMSGGETRRTMTRAEFMAAIRMRPRFEPEDDDRAQQPGANGETPSPA